MSIRLLMTIDRMNQGAQPGDEYVDPNHYVRDDVEFFLWVLCYAIMRHVVSYGKPQDLAVQKSAESRFSQNFGCLTIDAVLSNRAGLIIMNIESLKHGMSKNMRDWMIQFQEYLMHMPTHRALTGLELTHDVLIEKLDEGLTCIISPYFGMDSSLRC